MDRSIVLQDLKRDIIENIISFLHPNNKPSTPHPSTSSIILESLQSNEISTQISTTTQSLVNEGQEFIKDSTLQSPIQFDKTKTFANGNDLTAYIKDLALQEHKAVKITKSSGKTRFFACTDTNCTWYIRASKKLPPVGNGIKKRKTSSDYVPVDHWYMNAMNLVHHTDCTSVEKVSMRQLCAMEGMKTILAPGVKASKSEIIKRLKAVHDVDVSARSATIYRARRQLLGTSSRPRKSRKSIKEEDMENKIIANPSTTSELTLLPSAMSSDALPTDKSVQV